MYSVQFKLADVSDAMAIVRLRQQIWSTTYRGIYPDTMIDDFDYCWHIEKEVSRIQRSDFAVYLIEIDHYLVGYLTMSNGVKAILQSLYILAEYQGRGIGKAAIEYVKGYFRNAGRNEFICHCHPENRNARTFYEKMGGVVVCTDMDNEEHWQDSVTYQFLV